MQHSAEVLFKFRRHMSGNFAQHECQMVFYSYRPMVGSRHGKSVLGDLTSNH